jgi:hypothetical protein
VWMTGCWSSLCFTDQSPNFLTFKEPKNRFQGTNCASLCSLAGRYHNPIPTRFLAHTDGEKYQHRLGLDVDKYFSWIDTWSQSKSFLNFKL